MAALASDARTALIGPLCRLSDIPDGHSRGFDPLGEGRDSMFVVRQGAQVFAYRNSCPHYDRARMAWKKDEFLSGDRTQIVCGAHGALFEIATGACTLGPCLGQSLTRVQLVEQGGDLWIVPPFAPSRPARIGQSHA